MIFKTSVECFQDAPYSPRISKENVGKVCNPTMVKEFARLSSNDFRDGSQQSRRELYPLVLFITVREDYYSV